MNKKALFRWYKAVHERVREELLDVFVLWRTLHAEGMYPYHMQRVLHLGPGDIAQGLEFCKWLNGSRQLHRYSLFDEAQFNRDGVNNTHSCHVWADENVTAESNFQLRFSVNVWCAVLDDQLIGPFILEGRLTGEAYLRFLQEELPRLLEEAPLNKRGRMYCQHDGAPPHFHVKLKFPELSFPKAMDRTWRSPQLASQVSSLKPTGLLCMGMDERTGLKCEGGNARCIAWSHFGSRRPHRKQSAQAATSNSRSSQPSGSLCCGRRWHFRKPALSTDQFKLNVISRS